MAKRVKVRNLEWHVTHVCNLRCDNCSHLSNYGFNETPTLAETERQWSLWNQRIQPEQFSLLGGEPTIHPELCEVVRLARKCWPDSKLLLVTNGWFLDKHPELPLVLQENSCRIDISIHHNSKEYLEKVDEIRALVDDWSREYEFKYKFRKSYDKWRRVFLLWGKHLKPYHDNDPDQSWENCASKWCMQLLNGKIYKCPQLAYINMLGDKVELSPEWDGFRSYQPLEPTCTDDELEEFVARQVESYCSFCPAKKEYMKLKSPLPSPIPRI